jgi:multiple sugar transport system permease protein
MATIVDRSQPRSQIKISKIVLYMVAIIFALIWLAPLWITITTAVKSSSDFISNAFWLFPREFNLFQNVAQAWNGAGLGQGFVNSMIYGVVGAAIAVLIAGLASYGLVVLKVPGAYTWFLIIFSGTLFPFQIYIAPLYQTYNALGLYDTQIGMVIFYSSISIPFATLVMRGFFSTIPEEIAAAARVDGSSEIGVFWHMYIPLSLSAFFVVFLLQFTWIWNDLLFGLVLSNSNEVRPVMPSLSSLTGVYSGTSFTIVLAGALIASAPTLILFLGLQKYFLQGLTLSVKK